MASHPFDDFRISFTPRSDGTFDVDAIDARKHVAKGTFIPLPNEELAATVARFGSTRRRKAALGGLDAPAADELDRAARDLGSLTELQRSARQFGTALADALLTGKVGARFDDARGWAKSQRRGLRLSLSMADAPELLCVPWEFLHRGRVFLAGQRRATLVRVLEIGSPIPAPPAIDGAVRLLAVIATPRDLPPLDVAEERRKIEPALASVRDDDRVEVTWLEHATRGRFLDTLADDEYHILHFVGHGGFTEQDGVGALVFEDAHGMADLVDSTELAAVLAETENLRLVTLNSCEGARTSLVDPFAGVATTLIEVGVPAVIAMQFEISDEVAIAFAHELYTNLIGRQYPIDVAIGEARKAVYFEIDRVEWATPVLYVRDPDVEIFSFEVPVLLPPLPTRPDVVDEEDERDDVTAGVEHDLLPLVVTEDQERARHEQATREEQARRAERDRQAEIERQRTARARRRRRMRWAVGLALLALVAAGGALAYVMAGGGSDDGGSTTTTSIPGHVGRLASGESLEIGDRVESTTGRTVLQLAQGRLVASTDGEAWWTSDNPPRSSAVAFMQTDGNLTIYPSHDQTSPEHVLFATRTNGNPGAELVVDEVDGRGRIAIVGTTGTPLLEQRQSGPSVSTTSPSTSAPTSTVAPVTVTIPSVEGLGGVTAAGFLEAHPYLFDVEVESEAHPSVADGTAIGTQPAAGVEVAAGTHVTLIVSSGPGVLVPAVVGETEAAASARLQSVGLVVRRESVLVPDDADDGRVVGQSPAPRTRVEAGSTVTIRIGEALSSENG